jgi:predicted aspartyl protease
VKSIESAHDTFGGFSIVKIESADSTRVITTATSKKGGQAQRLSVITASVPPYAVTDFTIKPAESAARFAESDADANAGISAAKRMFSVGKFLEADSVCTDVLAQNPKNASAALIKGHLALLSNKLPDAQRWLTKAVDVDRGASEPKVLLAEAFYRQNDFRAAAPLLRTIGDSAFAAQLESFKREVPYRVNAPRPMTVVPFVRTNPLPIVKARINDGEEVNLLIDTGGAELVIAPELASRVGAGLFGSATGTYAGGLQSDFRFGRIKSVTLGEFRIANVPVHVHAPPQLPAFGMRVDGIIGTILLSKFISTLDYSAGQLTLRLKTSANLRQVEREASSNRSVVVPFWMSGDHYMVAWGSVNRSRPMLLFVDTGLAGGGFIPTESTLKEAGITIQEDNAGEGAGGGGRVRVVPIMVDELSLGGATERGVRGFKGPFLGRAFPFEIGGVVSHGFFRPYALTLDFDGMRLFLQRGQADQAR